MPSKSANVSWRLLWSSKCRQKVMCNATKSQINVSKWQTLNLKSRHWRSLSRHNSKCYRGLCMNPSYAARYQLFTALILGLRPANERHRYKVMLSIIGWAQPYNQPCNYHMMTSSNGNSFRVTGYLCGEFTGPWWIPRTKASDAGLWCFFDWINNREVGDLRHHPTHCAVIVMKYAKRVLVVHNISIERL